MKLLQKTWDWLVWSSSNSESISTTLKGALGVVTAVVANVIILGHLQIDPLLVQSAGDSFMNVVQAGLGFVTAVTILVSALVAFVGFVRKVVLTLKGDNSLLNNYY